MSVANVFITNNMKYLNLNQGIYENQFYYGKNILIEKKNTETIIFSNKKYLINYNKIKRTDSEWNNEISDFGIIYKQAPLDICPGWSNESIDKFTKGESEIIDKTVLYTTIKNQLQKYMDVTDDRIFDLVTTYIIGTYCHSMFNSYGYLFFNSDKESGKTKFMNLIELMCFNPINGTNPSESALFRICDLNSPTMLVDDYEGQDEERQRVINQILKVGYKRGGQVIRTEKNKDNNFDIRSFDVYSPKIISNTTELDSTTISRCIVIRLLKTTTNKGRLESDPNNPEWQDIRDNCYLFIMQNWQEIQEIYKEYNSEKFNNRKMELVKGILSIAKHINQNIHYQIESYLEQSFLDRDTEDLESNWDYLLFKTLYEQTNNQADWYSVSVINEGLKYELPEDNRPKNLRNWIGKRLSKIGLFQKRRIGAGVEYLLSKQLISKYMNCKGYPLDPTHNTQPTHKYKDDEISEISTEIMGDCFECNEHKFVKFKSVITNGRNYCKECVVRVKNKELLDKLY